MAFKSVYKFQRFLIGDKIVFVDSYFTRSIGFSKYIESYIVGVLIWNSEYQYILMNIFNNPNDESKNFFQITGAIIKDSELKEYNIISFERNQTWNNINLCTYCEMGEFMKYDCDGCPNVYKEDDRFMFINDKVNVPPLATESTITGIFLSIEENKDNDTSCKEEHLMSQIVYITERYTWKDFKENPKNPGIFVGELFYERGQVYLGERLYKEITRLQLNSLIEKIHNLDNRVYAIDKKVSPVPKSRINYLKIIGYTTAFNYNKCNYCFLQSTDKCKICKRKSTVWLGTPETLNIEEN